MAHAMAPGEDLERRFYIRQGMESPQLLDVAGGRVAVFSAAAPIGDKDNEDGAVAITAGTNRAVLAVADGLGGQRLGAEAAERALRALAERVIAGASVDDGLRSAILDGFERANERVGELGGGAATTLAAVEIDAATIRPYHVGDSMILVVGQRGKVKLHTVSHSPVAYAVEAGLLDAREAIHHEDRHLVSNIVGSAEMRIEVGRTLKLRPRDTVLVASDGLFDNLHLEEIVELVRKGPLQKAAQRLAVAGRKRMEQPQAGHPSQPDDLTFVLYRRS